MFALIAAGLAEIATEIPKAVSTVVPTAVITATPAVTATPAPEAAAAAAQTVESVFSGIFSTPQAIAAVIGAVSAALIAGIVNYLGVKSTDSREREQFRETIISKKRMEWVKQVRSLCMELCAICDLYDADTILKDTEKENLLAFYKARNGILLHLSPLNYFTTDDNLIKWLSPPPSASRPEGGFDAKADFNHVKQNIAAVRQTLTEISKIEWDKIKIEIGITNLRIRRRIDALQHNYAIAQDSSAARNTGKSQEAGSGDSVKTESGDSVIKKLKNALSRLFHKK